MSKTMTLKISQMKIPEGAPETDPLIVQEYVDALKQVESQGGDLLDYLSAKAIFADFTYINSRENSEKIQKRVWDDGGVAIIDYDHEHNSWCFHTLHNRDGVHKKQVAEKFRNAPRPMAVAPAPVEATIESSFASHLANLGENVQTQVACRAGIIDILTDTHVYEVERYFTRPRIFEAVGQVSLYCMAVGGGRSPAIVGPPNGDESLLSWVRAKGIEVVEWESSKDQE